MRTAAKVGAVVVAAALVAVVVALVWRGYRRPDVAIVRSASGGPAFEVIVEKPRVARPLFGILPQSIEEKLEQGGERRFDHTSPGAAAVDVEADRLELAADGWELVVEIDGGGKVGPSTHLVYATELGEREVTLRCRPADDATGYLRVVERPGSDVLDGTFLVELGACDNVASGKRSQWPPKPLTVYGSFSGLPRGAVADARGIGRHSESPVIRVRASRFGSPAFAEAGGFH